MNYSYGETVNISDLVEGKIYSIDFQDDVVTRYGNSLVISASGENVWIPEKWKEKATNSSYFITYGLKKRGDLMIYDIHFFNSYKEAKKHKETQLILKELTELRMCKIYKVNEYTEKKLKFGLTPIAVIDGIGYMLPTRLKNEIDKNNKYLIYFGKSKHTNFQGKQYERHDISFYSSKEEAKLDLIH